MVNVVRIMKNPHPKEPMKHDKKGDEKMEKRIKVVTETMKVNDKLFYKMQHDLDSFVEDTSKLPAEEVVDMAEEIAMKKKLLEYMEVKDISNMAARGFLKIDYPLSFLYSAYCRKLFSYKTIDIFLEQCGRALFESFEP